MLILSRHKGQRIIIDHDIVITVLETGSGQTRIGIDAPDEVKIYREELLQRAEYDREIDFPIKRL